MKKVSLSFLVALLSCFLALAQVKNLVIPLSETQKLISDLSSDKFLGRETGTEGYKLASDYVENYLMKNNINSFFKDTYKNSFDLFDENSSNIVALIGDYDKSKDHIVIGAHLDHIGLQRGEIDSVYNGANDNATGVTAVLQIAKELNKHKFDKNIIVALFAAEEVGLVGSEELAKKLKNDNIRLSYMINFEMIGKTFTEKPNQVYITGFNKSDLAKKMNKISRTNFVHYLPEEVVYNLFSRSDNYSFYKIYKIPSHTISTFDFKNYNHYHKLTDEVENLDVENMNEVINSTYQIIYELLKKNEKINLKDKKS